MRKLSRLLIIVLLLGVSWTAHPAPSAQVPTAKAAEPRLVIFEAYYSLS